MVDWTDKEVNAMQDTKWLTDRCNHLPVLPIFTPFKTTKYLPLFDVVLLFRYILLLWVRIK